MIEDLIPVAKDIHSIYNFLTNGGLEKVTFYISAKEMDAVRTIIKGISGEKNITNAINRIMVHLETAYELNNGYHWFIHSWKKADTNKNYICALMAICHKYIGSSDKLIGDWLVEKAVYTHMYEIPTIPRELIFELIRDKEYAEECAKKRDESYISLLPDNGDISLPPSL